MACHWRGLSTTNRTKPSAAARIVYTGPGPALISTGSMPATMLLDELDSDQSVICAAASLAETSMSWPAPCPQRWIRAQTMANAATRPATSPEMLPGGMSGSRSGRPAFQHMPEVASMTEPGTSRPA